MSKIQPFAVTGPGSLFFATIFPALVIAIELATGLCAGAFFDPMPTIGHFLLVASVPLVNALLWRALAKGYMPSTPLLLAGAATVVIALSYSLLFLPILPFALIAILLGIGFLPFGPVVASIFSWKWTAQLAKHSDGGTKRTLMGAALGFAMLCLADLPATATQMALSRYSGSSSDRDSAVGLMRALGDREMLLRLSYGDTARVTGLSSVLISAWSYGPFRDGSLSTDTAAARELYYRVTGQAFNALPRPGHGPGRGMRAFAWDSDRGGENVGGRVPDLALAGSRIDGSVAERDNLGQFEWTFDIANTGSSVAEARFTIALPEGAVASRATLWVNGEPREASIAGRGAARAAYQSVVSASRDPLLVTTDGAQRLIIQAFPINANSTMRLRIGFTAPFAIAPNGQRSLALPAIVERNFDMPESLRHAVWIDGDAPLRGATRTSVSDTEMLARRSVIGLPPVLAPRLSSGRVDSAAKAPILDVTQRIELVAGRSQPIMLVVSSSVDAKSAVAALDPALAVIPTGVPVGLVATGDSPVFVKPAPWSAVQADRVRQALKSIQFSGGEDPRPALARALAAIPQSDAMLVWIHGVQPVRFTSPEPTLEQALDRLPARPQLVRYQVSPGRALVLQDNSWFDAARLPTPSGDAQADLRAILADIAGGKPRWAITRSRSRSPSPSNATAQGSAGIVRLWAAANLASSAAGRGKAREDAIALAHRLNIVTPVSGAVVLETDRDYKSNGLPIPDADAVPTLPEPEVWALLILLLLAGGYLLRQRQPVVSA